MDFSAIHCSLPVAKGPLPRLDGEFDEHLGSVHSFAANGHVAHCILEGRRQWDGGVAVPDVNLAEIGTKPSMGNMAASLARERLEEVKRESQKEMVSNLKGAADLLPPEHAYRLKKVLKQVVKGNKKVW